MKKYFEFLVTQQKMSKQVELLKLRYGMKLMNPVLKL